MNIESKTEESKISTIENISHITLPEKFHTLTDIYINMNDIMESMIYPIQKQLKDLGGEGYEDIIKYMLERAQEKTKLEFSLNLLHEGTRIIFRGHFIKTLNSKIYIFRRLPSHIPKIETLGMPKSIIKLLTHDTLNKGGLVIIAGETGQGKSTTAGATIAHRLQHYGSFCLTIEDPMELPLQGFYDNPMTGTRGVCYQTEIEDGNITEAIKSSLRCYPAVSNSILFLGEIRDSHMASEVLRIAANGHLVITTMHALDIKNALMRFVSMATNAGGSIEESRSMLASVFRLLIHQRLKAKKSNKSDKEIDPQILFSQGHTSTIAARIKNGEVDRLSTDIQQQNAQIEAGKDII